MTPLACWLTMYHMLFINSGNENVLGGEAKGQLISEWIFDIFNFQKKNPQKFKWIFALEVEVEK